MPAPDWPTGPVVAPAPEGQQVLPSCEDPTCTVCQTAEVGARTITRAVGADYDSLPLEVRQHYAALAADVYADMGEALIRLGAVTVPDEPTEP